MNVYTDKQTRYKKTKCILGEGSYKTVTKAIDEEEGKEVAYNEVKIKSYEDETQSVSLFSKEIAILKTVDHPNILKILDYWFNEDDFIFITEFMTGGSLKDYIQKNGPLSSKLIKKWGKQVLEGLRYLHSLDPPIIHRDIKNDNVFVNTAVGDVKIGDLGLAKEKKYKRYTIVGTPNFMAREMFEGGGYTEKIDVYAFGMCLVEMATGKTPYIEFKDTTDIYKSVLQGILPKALHMIEDPCLKSLIINCIVPVESRYTASQCLDHHFFHPEIVCTGDCIPKECVAVYPLQSCDSMELSVISIVGGTVTFQILLSESMKFIKFEYKLSEDTVEKVCDELMAEKIVDDSLVESFSTLLKLGLEKVQLKIEKGMVRDGMIELDSSEAIKIKEEDRILSNKTHEDTIVYATPIENFEDESLESINFGPNTIEEMKLIEESIKIAEAKMEIEKKREEEITQRLKSALQMKQQTPEIALDDTLVCNVEMTKSVKFKDDVPPRTVQSEIGSETIYSQLPNEKWTEHERLQEIRKQQENEKLKLQENEVEQLKSPQNTAKTAEHHSNETDLNDEYEPYKTKYKNNYPISQYTLDTATVTGRTEETAKSWLRELRDEDIETVFDLKLMVYEDWEKLPLTVFSSRAMQNMLYGVDGVPLKEKQLPHNAKLKEYDNKMSIKDFLEDICGIIDRKELVSSWEDRLLAQDIQTVGELKSLHHDDWNRLGLTAFAYRILKNSIYRKGKIVISE